VAWNTATVTQHGPPTSQGKAFAWSYSRLKNFEACPARYYNIDVLKRFKDDGEALGEGIKVHKMLEDRVAKGTPLPAAYEAYEPWIQKLTKGAGKILTEQQLAITANFEPCDWFSKQTWFRAKIDLLKLNGPVALCADYKTGKILEDAPQLVLSAACVFYHHPQVQKIRTMYVWLKDNCDTTVDISRDELPEMWASLWSRIEQLRFAHERTDFPPTPNRLCKQYCAVVACPHNGKRTT